MGLSIRVLTSNVHATVLSDLPGKHLWNMHSVFTISPSLSLTAPVLPWRRQTAQSRSRLGDVSVGDQCVREISNRSFDHGMRDRTPALPPAGKKG